MENKFKVTRTRNGLSQRKVSDSLGIPLRTIQAWESGERIPPPYAERLVIAELERIGKSELNTDLKTDDSESKSIRQARHETGLSQEKISEITGIPRRTLQDWEAGKRTPPPYVERLVVAELERIAKKNADETEVRPEDWLIE